MNQPSPTTPLIFRTGMGEKNGKSKLPEKSTDFVDDGVYRQTGVEKWVNTLLCRGDLAKESFQAKPVGVLDLFKYAEEHDRLLILIGLTSSIITGAVQALVAVMAGKLATALIESDQG
uniref:ABC transmembrane type-1 domain-containing protein n=1 Tax=Bursaphelenchus xylophilus TaxID=6326 RepID=A0A1I7SFY0_BURXY